ncbi:FBP domain-containing protein [Agrococcus sp. SL85]|uniref:FBP domain-containing protein n=1 Tax=Agrococcus sp. SL85 TaxID=2995141 RepID=UPI00226CB276|nr:FBP domain-containing protein [Agrococcus sp. SL85]WAC66213.1 FBP domain-containing protein [Agrococcus sp. SL85]
MRQVTEDELRGCFVNATDRELAQLPIPGLHETIWEEREYLGWRDARSARLGYLVHWQGDRLVGIVVRAAPGGMRPGIAAMCARCHSTQPATQVRMFSARLAGPQGEAGSTVGTYICEDLACSHIIRSGPPHLVSRERVAWRAEGLEQRVTRFTDRIARDAPAA